MYRHLHMYISNTHAHALTRMRARAYIRTYKHTHAGAKTICLHSTFPRVERVISDHKSVFTIM